MDSKQLLVGGPRFTSGLALGAALMFALDPREGARAGPAVRDKVLHRAHEVENALDVGSRESDQPGCAACPPRCARALHPGPVPTRCSSSGYAPKLGRVPAHAGGSEVHALDA